MSRFSVSSADSAAEEMYDPKPLDTPSQPNVLHRQSTNGSGVSRILEGIRDDHQQDNEEYVVKSAVPLAEEAIHDELDRVSRQLTYQSKDKAPSIESLSHTTSTEEESGDHPVDGLFAIWQAVLTMLLVFSTWGANAAFGVFLNYYMSNSSFPGADNYDFALIGGIVVFLAQALAPVCCFFTSMFGQTPVLLTGLVCQTAGYMLASFCTKLWQIYLCQGVLVGTSFSLIFIPGTMILPTWFSKRKSTAMGICVSGAGLGGLVFSLSLNKLISQTGDQRWPLRMVGFVTLGTTIFSMCFMRQRNKKTIDINTSKITWERCKAILKVVFNIELFKSLHFVVLGCWFGLCLLGYVICLYSFSPYASSVGLTHDQANNLLAILNAAQVVGRPCVGNLADYFGRTNTASVFCVYLAILILAFWRNATSYAALIVLSILLGGPAGVGSIMAQSLGADILDVQERPELMPAAWSGLNIIVSIYSLPSEVIAIALKDEGKNNVYDHAQTFTGCMFLLAAVLLSFNREYIVRRKFEKRRAHAQAAATGYLKASDLVEAEDRELPMTRIERYDRLLQPGIIYYFIRMFYPIRV
ncbi:hypothetical protein FT663_00829 [Candidozyma haemuli var. vulneris]|uniref:Major facilitator superfamily (MFS) profile domain-containing protein n=1 Tax=Candidozyma haemuli TaxID=45357 RepID=A0A2V1AVW4_9ASCO|nr:hypothetical protein CXQ85_004596 [[Candida] haemuloni]KAF3988394.1 hypothetical protein FT662_03427 [[Candida] haemuloni var. vulneris]KAF3994993.1 hypothetical protein FT663_00829 [[Candida] haemuloni var. vulneris]PVH21932.1 hypothetical protein CXQ85_004596 [[Candida] haemuloni]